MKISKRTAMGVTGLAFAGVAALGVGAAIPAGANVCCGNSHSRDSSSVSLYNKNFNFSRSDDEQAQRTHQRQFDFDHRNDFNNREEDHHKKWD
jgi:hypothetical protein